MVNDQEPRYRLVDADGNVVGSLFAESDGTLKLQEGTSGNDNELSLTTQGALEAEQRTLGPGPDVEEIIDGTISQSGSQTATYQLNNSYDRVEIKLGLWDPAGTTQDLIFRLNGDSGSNYNFVDESNTRTSGADGFRVFSSLDGARPIEDGIISVAGEFGAQAAVSVDSLGTTAAPTGKLSYGANFNITSPVDSITFAGGSGNISVQAVIKGINYLSI